MSIKREFFVVTVSDPAPFCSDVDESYRRGLTAELVLASVKRRYDHPAGLHSAAVFASADAYKKGKKALASFKHSCRF